MGKVIQIKTAGFSDAAMLKLESSGLTPEQATQLGMTSVGNASTLDAQFEGTPALVIPYYGVDGKPLMAHPKWPDFYRIRYLGESKGGFKEASGAKPSRYSQPKNTGVCAYFPQIADWKALAKDPSEPLLITEGELKAAKATAEGFPTIGLGGVYSFRSANQGVFFLPELEAIEWARRRVTIVYDSDYATNPMVCSAINTLAEELMERGALTYVATLDNIFEEEGSKTGLDDFLIEKGDEGLIAALKSAEPLGMTRRLWSMNQEVVYVRDPGMVVSQFSAQKMDCAKFAAHSDWATIAVPERRVSPKGDVSVVKSAAAPVWLKWPLRRAVDKLSYLPGQDRFTTVKGVSYLNQWKGWGCEPKKGDVKPWLELIKFIFKDAEPEAVEWFLDWCAYPIQFPGAKLFAAVLIHGRLTGTGKTLIGYTLAKIYGDNFTKLSSEDLFGDTWWAENRQFVLGDEISGSDKRNESDQLKALITQEEINVNIKYIPQFTIPDCINYFFTSNHADAMFVEDEDRRYFIHEVLAEAALPESFYQAYDKWRLGDGPSYLMHHLLQRDLSKFNPKGPAFKTAARERMVRAGKSDIATWVADLKEDPTSKLRIGQMRHARDLFTSVELLAMYEAENERAVGKVTANGMSRALAAAGFRQVYDSKPLKDPNGRQGRYYAIRDREKWLRVRDGKALTKNIALPPVRA